MWKADGLAPPQKVLLEGEEYREEQDDLSDFFREYLVKDPAAKIGNERLYELYLRWCEDVGEKKPLNRTWMGRRLSDRGCKRDRESSVRGWKGIGER